MTGAPEEKATTVENTTFKAQCSAQGLTLFIVSGSEINEPCGRLGSTGTAILFWIMSIIASGLVYRLC